MGRRARWAWALLAVTAAAPGAFAAEPEPTRRTPKTAADEESVTKETAPEPAPMDLPDLLRAAAEQSPQVLVSRAEVTEAEALCQLAEAQAYPKLTVMGLFGGPTPETKTRVRNDITSITPASYGNDLNFGTLGVTLRTSLEASWPIYTFGKIEAGNKAAAAARRAAEAKVEVTRSEVLINVVRAFWTYQLTRSFIDSLTDGRKTLQKVLERIEDLLESDSGQVTENDRMRMVHAIATLDVRRTQAEGARVLTERALCLLTGRPQSEPLSVVRRALALPDEDLPLLKDALADVNAFRPELRAIKALVRAHQELVRLRKAALLPDFFIGALFRSSYTSNATNQTNPFIFDPYNDAEGGIGLGFRLNFDLFTKLAVIEQAEASLRVRRAQAHLLREAIELDVRKLHIQIANGYRQARQLKRANRSARGWLTASALGYDIGTGEAAELIDAFLAWAASEAELKKTQYDLLVNLAQLSRSAGRLLASAPMPSP